MDKPTDTGPNNDNTHVYGNVVEPTATTTKDDY
jgi:hypothetical protein